MWLKASLIAYRRRSSQRVRVSDTGDVRATMFSEPVAPAPPAPAAVVEAKPPPPEPVDPYADWNYTGSATIGEREVRHCRKWPWETHDGYLLKAEASKSPGYELKSCQYRR